MSVLSPFCEARAYRRAHLEEIRGVRMAADFGDLTAPYRAARERAALFDRSDRGLLAVLGPDRATWLNNLVTNIVTGLEENTGTYAFALNVRGRILFDLNILCLPEQRLWLDIDRLAISVAATHFDRHLFVEKVRIEDQTGQVARLACCGPSAPELAARLGVPNLLSLPPLTSTVVSDSPEARLFRHNTGGLAGFELVVSRGQAAEWWDRLADLGALPAGYRTWNVLRIEAGIPWLGYDLDDSVLPMETGLRDLAICFHKGCYLGQEIVERMRARGAVARRLVQLRLDDGESLLPPVPLVRDGQMVGKISSLAKHPLRPYWVGLGFLASSVTGFAEISAGDPPRRVTICSV